jgi:hypothetical protein
MKRMMRAAAVAALVAGGTGSIGCTHGGRQADDGTGGGGVYRSFVDPCWPERYSMEARHEVLAPFAQQVNNGNTLHQTIWNWYFEPGTDKLNTAGRAKLDTIAQTRPHPDTRLYLQAARDVVVTNDNMDKVGGERDTLTQKRAAAIQKYMSTQPAIGGNALAYEIYVHDAAPTGMPADFAAAAYRGQGRGYSGMLPGSGGSAGGMSPLATGGGGGGSGGANTGPTSGAPTGGGTSPNTGN